MITIAFIHHNKAFLPGIPAYCKYFSARGIKTVVVDSTKKSDLRPDVSWQFMGFQRKAVFPRSIIIHEYASASMRPLSILKNKAKAFFNHRPMYRLFLNEQVAAKFNFFDDVPTGFRDVGIPSTMLKQYAETAQKDYDFIFCGGITRDMKFHKLLDAFAKGPLGEKRIMILSNHYQRLKNRYAQHKNILFEGPVPQEQVSQYLAKARYGINYKPAIEPYLHQTSTKILEYAACGLPVVTTNSPWLRQFKQRYGGNYFIIDENLKCLDLPKLEAFDFKHPSLQELTWEKQIERSGIIQFLEKTMNISIPQSGAPD